MKILLILCVLIAAYFLVSLLTILKNGVSLIDEPGLAKRFKLFMTTNIAETSENHSFPELITQTYPMTAEELKQKVIISAESLGWKLTKEKEHQNDEQSQRSLSYVVTTSLAKFNDDIEITLSETKNNATQLNIKSESRVGRADFAANIGHIINF